MATKTRSYYYDWEKIAEPILEESKARAARGVSLTTKYGQPCNTAQSVNSQNKPRSPRKFDTPEERDEAIAQGKLPGLSGLLRNKRNIWKIPIGGNHTPHPAPFPVDLPKTCILVSCPTGGTVLDPFAGSGTTLFAAKELGMHAIGIELNHEYCEIIAQRCGQLTISF